MAAQYDVNLEKCALLKCLCCEWKRVHVNLSEKLRNSNISKNTVHRKIYL